MRIGQFIYPWGNGHYTRMMRLNEALPDSVPDFELHASSRPPIYERLRAKFQDRAHSVMMPVPIDGSFGPSLTMSTANVLFPVRGNPPLIRQIADYLRKERALYDSLKFDIVINDGDMGSNVLAQRRGIPSLFVTNQYKPKLWKSRFYFYPALRFIARQIAKATRIIVADSPPPYAISEYNLNFPDELKDKVFYAGHYAAPAPPKKPKTDMERLIEDADFGYWMRTGNKSTNDGTGRRYEKIFAAQEMKDERRVVSHARNDSSIDAVTGRDGARYGVSEALEKKIDWIQIDVGFLAEQEMESVLKCCRYAVANGSHTVLGEILGGKSKPVLGIPVYDEHTNQLRWVQERGMGILAENTRQAVAGIARIRSEYAGFEEALADFGANFDGNGAANTARMIPEMLESKK